ncbi:LysR family transcriptional regulator [Chitinasiproducens palmae]|uniref:DNA-binding transcriptional regulator, LysR family n=1 Tax=Chitinasiproducens palmae TaxID=1770053 RepID=A0A1H2PX57_9BURK|nr:LysR family transcriptional regulator [Chitinasiproducens palmae]SDV51558.1 DNA-binding transcriptional regulator, LysR family [Chitinasiproducens palmae]
MSETVPIRFSLRQLRYFVATAEALSFTAAAKTLHISQPSISTALSELEQSFGIQLFIRHHAHGLSMTPAGQDLLAKARELLRNAEELQAAASEMDEGLTGTIALGCLVSLAPPLIPGLISDFVAKHAGIAFRTLEAHQDDLLQSLRSGLLDVALTYDLDLTDDISFVPLLALPPYAILPKSHRLATGAPIGVKDLAGEPFVMLDLPQTREYFSSLFDGICLRPSIAFRSAQPEVVRGLVANGMGCSILNFPLQHTTTVDGREFAIARFRDKLRGMTLGLACSRSVKPRRVVREFAAFCSDVIGQHGKQFDAAVPARRLRAGARRAHERSRRTAHS